jgi:hypothetical protein
MFVHTATEYWSRAGSLLHTDVAGTADLELPPEVRVYLVAGAQHLGGGPADPGNCRQPRNVLDDRGPVLRALLTALDEWVTNGTAPPPNRHPRVADGTLVDVAEFRARFPRIPGVELPEGCYRPPRLDFGPRFHTEGIADVVPPRTGPPYHTLVPTVDADGNETTGIRLPDVAVPLGTFTGWNLRAERAGAPGMLAPLDGMFLPFAATRAERLASGDPRPAVQERYPTREAYLARVAEAALALQAERFLLAELRWERLDGTLHQRGVESVRRREEVGLTPLVGASKQRRRKSRELAVHRTCSTASDLGRRRRRRDGGNLSSKRELHERHQRSAPGL